MAMGLRKTVSYVFKLLILLFIQQTICETHDTNLYSSQRLWQDRNGIIMSASSTPIKASISQARLYPGVIAAVVFVSFAAMLAAVFIIRKYYFPRSETIYRYSVLRRTEADWSGETKDDNEKGRDTLGEDSDEDMLD